MTSPANFAFWDTVHDFDSREIGWLWCGLEPPGTNKSGQTLPAMGYRILQDIEDALKKGQLARARRYSRSALHDWAESHSLFRPRFLFPPAPTRTDLTLDTALEIIAILAKAADARWTPNKDAPHGMIKKLTEAAVPLGLQLHRNTISNYLKEDGKKIISAQ